MDANETYSYDTVEAEDIAVRLAGESLNRHHSAVPAAVALVAELERLLRSVATRSQGRADFGLERSPDGYYLIIRLPHKNLSEILVEGNGEGVAVSFLPYKQRWLAAISFNPMTGQWEGMEPDPLRVREPGKPVPRRSALATVMATVAKMMRGNYFDESCATKCAPHTK